MKVIRPMRVDDAALVSSDVPETEHAAWSSVTAYDAADRAIKAHRIWESVQGANTNHDPVTDDGTWWIEIGPTNRWAMFDEIVQTQTTQADSVSVQLQAVGRIDTVAMLNIAATSALVRMTDSIDGVVYEETFGLVSTEGILDWSAYFFEPIARKTDLIVQGLPPYANALLDVELTQTGGTVKCGVLIPGFSRTIGTTLAGAGVGIRDYSTKETDDFGRAFVVERAFAKRATFQVLVDNAMVDGLQTLLATYRATPILYVGSERFAATTLYGFYKDFGIDIAYPEHALCSLEIEALT